MPTSEETGSGRKSTKHLTSRAINRLDSAIREDMSVMDATANDEISNNANEFSAVASAGYGCTAAAVPFPRFLALAFSLRTPCRPKKAHSVAQLTVKVGKGVVSVHVSRGC